MALVGGILALIVAGVLYNSSRGLGGPIFFGVVGVVLVLYGLHDDG
jgi:hypothetical protein